MSRELFVDKTFNADHESIIVHANEILDEFRAQGFTLTLRQLYYQFVARDLLKNTVQEYKRLGSVISDARLAGRIDWAAIEDRLRQADVPNAWNDAGDILGDVPQWYQQDRWAMQRFRPEVWIEKDALAGIIEPVCQRWLLPSLACRGYLSQSAQYEAGKRCARHIRNKQKPVILHLGDHDPSGIDMTRDNSDRLGMFSRMGVKVVRLALNMDQIEQYDPPPNPAKETDSRHSGYAAKFGDSSWELDALTPTVIDELIDGYVRENLLDSRKWQEAEEEEERQRATLQKLSDRWDDVLARLDEEEE